jgi:hypothetical protein
MNEEGAGSGVEGGREVAGAGERRKVLGELRGETR